MLSRWRSVLNMQVPSVAPTSKAVTAVPPEPTATQTARHRLEMGVVQLSSTSSDKWTSTEERVELAEVMYFRHSYQRASTIIWSSISFDFTDKRSPTRMFWLLTTMRKWLRLQTLLSCTA